MNSSADACLTARARDPRIDFTRGLANWFIFLDHIPHNAVSLLVTGTRIFRRVWQLYAAYVVLFVIYIDVIGNVAAQYAATDIIDEYNIIGLVDEPTQTLMHGLMLQAKPLNLDTLQLFIALMAFFPLILWAMMLRPNLALAASVALYFAARYFGWGFAAFPSGSWYFNPYCWQLLFVLGAWFALNGTQLMGLVRHSPLVIAAASAYLLFALVVTIAAQLPDAASFLPDVLLDSFMPNDKENLAVFRVVHFLALALVFTCLVSRDWSPMRWTVLQPIIKC